jgi:hypothetical protein
MSDCILPGATSPFEELMQWESFNGNELMEKAPQTSDIMDHNALLQQ